ncbi:MAG: IMP dehydrogenase [Candidatus Buchananbacteria bacterium RIFCSPHIGHO2_02_FULL_40_13]|uniref:Inosine-5'-monophosphate dehydrogenase n=1 Tax=Candidatus Buchananbacteria bacterium RIFCSPLOWO2_01_FULL_39_33 TaxID=1797543 RepID=A0A1G1YIZ4_9BACT|nr:MAG: IMP dehydrogenase [Candidatus Buchananbacteria bacterium RIFCSPHIGHO2_01_FULL_40_35]OGY49517.1 MAG: IMP dehydrogenase [Candidatus Buchananbacteria bacterium RIFCSPHIGHO2_02_FULL_40_13]OGY51670.1 MAG: IMP dehydrogenase [Candidatus Buchananbacteria bacterium RIFCSPLOWO2_01_FULL_39_33]
MYIPTALSYDDVLLVPQKSEVKSRQDVDTSTQLTRNISLKIPIVSANMDTVTESAMAIAMAQEGGIGIVHRFCDITKQVSEIKRVKRKQNIIITHPFIISSTATLADFKNKSEELNCSAFLVSDDNTALLGLITRRDVVFCSNDQTLVRDIMTPREKLIVAPVNIPMEEAKKILKDNKIEKLPLVDANFQIKGLITEKDIMRNSSNTQASKDNLGRLLVGAAIGVRGDYLARAVTLTEAGADILVLDIAHGHSTNALEAIKIIKRLLPHMELIGGNIATAQGALDLIEAGVDGVKVGIGPGSICTTRLTTGFGVPQLSAVLNVAPVCKKYGVPLIADGGIRQSADLVKALAAGADTVMMGGQLSGTEESPGPTINYQGRQCKISRGMASLTAALSRPDAKEKHHQITPEGIEARVPYRGPVKNILARYLGGLRSGMSYGNAQTIKDLRNCQFIRITKAGLKESEAHDNEVL